MAAAKGKSKSDGSGTPKVPDEPIARTTLELRREISELRRQRTRTRQIMEQLASLKQKLKKQLDGD